MTQPAPPPPFTPDLAALEAFARTGYFVAERAVPEPACEALCAALSSLIERVAEDHLAARRTERSFWKLLPASTRTADVFFDESAAPLESLPAPQWESRAMRIGHGLHLADPAFAAFCARPELREPLFRFADVAFRLSTGASPDAAARAASDAPAPAAFVQSAVIYKQPHSEVVQFGFHRDAAYLPTDPESLVLAFIALDPCTPENGCLAVVPGTHTEPLGLRFLLTPQGFVTSGREPRVAEDRAVLLSMPRGSVAFVHGRTQHASAPNRSSAPRRALIVHAQSSASQLTPDAWVHQSP
ncbi:MAG: phytanoyl-CoA dioxygenase family protein [Polyangiaceae bacterium]